MRFSIILLFLVNLTGYGISQEVDFDLNTIPSDWISLTQTDSGLIIFNSCDAGNQLLKITQDSIGFCILIHGQQENSEFRVKKSILNDSNQVIMSTIWKDSENSDTELPKVSFKFNWLDESKMIGNWIIDYWGYPSSKQFCVSSRQFDFPIIDQPCRECWGDECEYFPIEIIRKIFKDYIKYNESTDSEEDKKTILENIKKINYTPGVNDYLLLINVWMYYDPTDFAVQPDIYEIFKRDIDKSIKMINYRIANPKEWENNNSAQYSNLKDLISRLKYE